jgi:hypothetical protein
MTNKYEKTQDLIDFITNPQRKKTSTLKLIEKQNITKRYTVLI